MVKIGPGELAFTEPQPPPGSSMSSDVVGAHYTVSSCVAANLLMKMADSVGTATPRTGYAGSRCSMLQGPLVRTPLASSVQLSLLLKAYLYSELPLANHESFT